MAGAGHRHGDRPSRVQSSLLLVCMVMVMMMMIMVNMVPHLVSAPPAGALRLPPPEPPGHALRPALHAALLLPAVALLARVQHPVPALHQIFLHWAANIFRTCPLFSLAARQCVALVSASSAATLRAVQGEMASLLAWARAVNEPSRRS